MEDLKHWVESEGLHVYNVHTKTNYKPLVWKLLFYPLLGVVTCLLIKYTGDKPFISLENGIVMVFTIIIALATFVRFKIK
jgi:hypothetical protein